VIKTMIFLLDSARPVCEHESAQGADVGLHGEHDQLTEVYCLDDDCPWSVRFQTGAIALIVSEPVPEEPKP
jgi:hypothetical protein